MALTKAVLGDGARLSDFLCASLFARVVPPEVVHAVLNEHGRNTQRVRSFPAVAGVYYCMALSWILKVFSRPCRIHPSAASDNAGILVNGRRCGVRSDSITFVPAITACSKQARHAASADKA